MKQIKETFKFKEKKLEQTSEQNGFNQSAFISSITDV